MYPQSYHDACAALIRLDIMAPPETMRRTPSGEAPRRRRVRRVRAKVARAVRDVRRVHGRNRARAELARFRYVGVPLKEWC